ncbi:30S ribosome-binding factor RbfA [Wenzhouxiangella marina]|uniref:Ribosome-binding factor A n=1 Tax=Wenzhouxiangella marina TaxID=1579979 RepID=A0A0K0XYQ2_9GAMM|nr:30S ribosome-binding factor RbfA [Wenzhouxiangella marina]AKS42800.1 ribosome-binding factor A [Wenzhouxiangella marina]MBB6087522.1 ribosome-binding factor A [Wenzhouxiangella marina]
MSVARAERVAGLLRRELADIVQHEFEYDIPRGLISITDVEVARDLSHCKVYVAVLEIEQAPEIVAFLNEHAGQVRHELGKRIRLRLTPSLKFLHDTSSETGQRIEQLLAASRKPR